MILHFGSKHLLVKFGRPSDSRRKLRKKGQPGKRKATTKPIGFVPTSEELESLKNCHDGPVKVIYE